MNKTHFRRRMVSMTKFQSVDNVQGLWLKSSVGIDSCNALVNFFLKIYHCKGSNAAALGVCARISSAIPLPLPFTFFYKPPTPFVWSTGTRLSFGRDKTLFLL
jgi:hypothetical protein